MLNKFNFLKSSFVRSILLGIIATIYVSYYYQVWKQSILTNLLKTATGVILALELFTVSIINYNKDFGVLNQYKDQIIFASMWIIINLSYAFYNIITPYMK